MYKPSAISIEIHRIGIDDPSAYPLGHLLFIIRTGPATISVSQGPCNAYSMTKPTFQEVEEFRKEMVALETQLARGIEEVRALLENLPTTSIESAPTAPLFVDEAVS